jgi:hypothetical protein
MYHIAPTRNKLQRGVITLAVEQASSELFTAQCVVFHNVIVHVWPALAINSQRLAFALDQSRMGTRRSELESQHAG